MAIQPKTDTAIKVDSIAEKSANAGLALIDPVTIRETLNYAGTTAGTSSAYTATLTPSISAYFTGQRFSVKMHTACASAPTINFNSVGAKTIKWSDGSSVGAGSLLANETIDLIYDGTDMLVMGPPKSALQNSGYLYAGTTGGSSSAYTASLPFAPSAYAAGQVFVVKIHANCSASPTINFNSLGAKNIVKVDGRGVVARELAINTFVSLLYDGANFVILGCPKPVPICSGPITGFDENKAATAIPWFGSSILDFHLGTSLVITRVTVQWSAAWNWNIAGTATFRFKKNYVNEGSTFTITEATDNVLSHSFETSVGYSYGDLLALSWETTSDTIPGGPYSGLLTMWGLV